MSFELSIATPDRPAQLREAWLSLDEEGAQLRTASGRTTADFALQCIGGATLALLSHGYYVDDQNGIACGGDDAIDAATQEIKAFVASSSDEEKSFDPFPGWETFQ